METKSKLYLRIIGGLIIFTSITYFFFSPNYEHFKRGFNEGLNDGRNGLCSTDEVVTITNTFDTNQNLSSLKNIGLTSQTKTVDIELKGKNIYYKIPFYGYILLVIMMGLCGLALLTFIYFLRKLIRGEIFEKSTYKSLIILGFSFVASPFLEYFHNMITTNAKADVLKSVQLNLVNSNTFNFPELLVGLFIIAFAIAFRLGINIKQENDLTV